MTQEQIIGTGGLALKSEPSTKPSSLSPIDANADSYHRKLKRLFIPMANIHNIFLKSQGRWAVAKVGNVPEDVRIVGASIQHWPFGVVLYLYHADFLSIPQGTEPPSLKVNWERMG